MPGLPDIAAVLTLATALILVAAWHGAQFWAWHLKSMDLRPRRLTDFWGFGWSWDIEPIINFYTDLHRDYRSRLITGCVWAFRISLPLLIVLGAASLISLIMR